jgi:hypothetical protein
VRLPKGKTDSKELQPTNTRKNYNCNGCKLKEYISISHKSTTILPNEFLEAY